MKRIVSIMVCAVMLASVLSVASLAGPNYINPNLGIGVPLGSPEIDGVIEGYEGWSAPGNFNYDTAGFFWAHMSLTTEGIFFFSHDADGFYFAAQMTEHDHVEAYDQNGDYRSYDGNTLVYSDCEQPVDRSYGWNGDVITLMLDPGGVISEETRYGRSYTPWYNIGIFNVEGKDVVRVYRSNVRSGEITDSVKAAVVRSGETWTVEVFFPWKLLSNDVMDMSRTGKELTAEEMAAEGFRYRAAVSYMDRCFDPVNETIETWGRYITVCRYCPDGVPGYASSGVYLNSYGLNMVNIGKWKFDDVPSTAWYASSVILCNEVGLMSGVSENRFAPSSPLTRAMFATVLSRIDRADTSSYTDSSFADVDPAKWYAKPIEWAKSNGYTAGVGKDAKGRDLFAPDSPLTREQMVQFFFTYVKSKDISWPEVETDLSSFIDVDEISAWARDAVEWAYRFELISGVGGNRLAPRAVCYRSQAAVVIRNMFF